MAQGRSTQIISMINWIRTSRLSIKKSLSGSVDLADEVVDVADVEGAELVKTCALTHSHAHTLTHSHTHTSLGSRAQHKTVQASVCAAPFVCQDRFNLTQCMN